MDLPRSDGQVRSENVATVVLRRTTVPLSLALPVALDAPMQHLVRWADPLRAASHGKEAPRGVHTHLLDQPRSPSQLSGSGEVPLLQPRRAEGREHQLMDARSVPGQPATIARAVRVSLAIPPALLQQRLLLAGLAESFWPRSVVIPMRHVEPWRAVRANVYSSRNN
jgi:hypothetical protein